MPRKTVAGGALIRDGYDRILFVQPRYKPTLEIPGGIVEENESPYQACRREIREEIGLDIEPGQLLVVDWRPRHGVWSDSLNFIFDGGVLTDEQASRIKVAEDELVSLAFLSLDQAEPNLLPSMARRLSLAVKALRGDGHTYADFGRRPS